MEAEISEDGSVESGNVRKNPQAGESGDNASSGRTVLAIMALRILF